MSEREWNPVTDDAAKRLLDEKAALSRIREYRQLIGVIFRDRPLRLARAGWEACGDNDPGSLRRLA